MTNSKNTRRALLISVLTMTLSFVMLIGTTFAWFTDSVSSGKNKIVAGNLDIEVTHTNNNVENEELKDAKLFPVELWEPGVVSYETFTVKNVGSLAFDYMFNLNVADFNTVTVEGTEKSLKDVIKLGILEGSVGEMTREELVAAVKAVEAKEDSIAKNFTSFSGFSFKGNMEEANTEKTFTMVAYWEPTENDNDYNVNGDKTVSKLNGDKNELYIEIIVNVEAKQRAYENDSFGSDYDDVDVWDGTYDNSWYSKEETSLELATAEQVVDFFTNMPENFNKKTITLNTNVDLSTVGEDFKISWKSFNGTFDGNGYAIKNFNYDHNGKHSNSYGAGIFHETINATIKDLYIVDANITGANIVGAVAGYAYNTTFENVHVISSSISGYGKIGGLVGLIEPNSACTFKDCSVENTNFNGVYNIGGLVGNLQDRNCTFENCSVSNNTWTQEGWAESFDGVTNKYYYAGELVRADADTCHIAPEKVSGIYWIYSGYYFAGYADYYCAYFGSTSHDCPIENNPHAGATTGQLGNSEYCVNTLE